MRCALSNRPSHPKTPARPQVLLITGAGFLAGLMLGLLFALILEQLDTGVHTSEELTELTAWPVLGTIWRKHISKQQELVNPSVGMPM